jgi:WD40 repeat protein
LNRRTTDHQLCFRYLHQNSPSIGRSYNPARCGYRQDSVGHILTASDDNTARLWDRDGKPLATLQGHTGAVNSAAFAPDGGRILTASDDNTARLWDRDGKPLATLQGHTGAVLRAVFAPDGGRSGSA